jgi:hypothetical protein
MITVVPIVEGHGEVAALPALLHRFGALMPLETGFLINEPIRVHRDRFLSNRDEFKRMLGLAALKCLGQGWILILLDADDDCPKELGETILQRAREVAPESRISVVFANREYEAWFVAAAASLNGVCGFEFHDKNLPEAESIRGAKEWISKRIRNGRYHEVQDQPVFTRRMNLEMAMSGSRSLRKLYSEWQKQMTADSAN